MCSLYFYFIGVYRPVIIELLRFGNNVTLSHEVIGDEAYSSQDFLVSRHYKKTPLKD
jgi:hypothetical protein